MTGFVEKPDVNEWIKNKTVEYAARFGSGYNKRLSICLDGNWIVEDHRHEIYKGDIDTAIATYNSILPKRT